MTVVALTAPIEIKLDDYQLEPAETDRWYLSCCDQRIGENDCEHGSVHGQIP